MSSAWFLTRASTTPARRLPEILRLHAIPSKASVRTWYFNAQNTLVNIKIIRHAKYGSSFPNIFGVINLSYAQTTPCLFHVSLHHPRFQRVHVCSVFFGMQDATLRSMTYHITPNPCMPISIVSRDVYNSLSSRHTLHPLSRWHTNCSSIQYNAGMPQAHDPTFNAISQNRTKQWSMCSQ